MRPLRLRARNLRTFPDLDISFESGLVGILGELRDAPGGADSNGAGKSTLLEAIDIALFGRRSLAGYLTRGGDADELMVELTFSHAESMYRVRRTYSARGRGKTGVDLEQDVDDRWVPLTLAATKETDELIRNIVGLSRETFRDSVYLRQGDGGYADPDRDPRQRKELLVEAVLGRDPVWPRLADLAKQRRKAAEVQLERIAGERDALSDTLSGRGDAELQAAEAARTVAEAVAAVTAAEAEFAAVGGRYQEAREQASVRQAVEAELRELEQAVRALKQRETAAAAANLDIVTARDELETLATEYSLNELVGREAMLDALLESFRQATVEYEQARRDREIAFLRRNELLGRASEANEKAEELRMEASMLDARPLDDGARCDHCGQILGLEARDERLAKYANDAKVFDAQARALDDEAKTIELPELPPNPVAPQLEGDTAVNLLIVTRAAIARSRDELAQRARLEERITQLQQTVSARPDLEDLAQHRSAADTKRAALDALEPVNLVLLEQQGRAARATVDGARRHHEQAVTTKARCDERLDRITLAAARLDELDRDTEKLRADVDRDLLLERAYGRDGIPALIIENTAIPYLETEAGRILSLLGTSFQVELRTQAENKTGGLRDTLDVVVIDQDGDEAGYEDGCSGGEQTRIGLALRIALARLLAHRRGAESRLLALDEPSYLDQAGMVALLDVLRSLETDFDLILLVSHVPELRDALDEVITVVKENGRSTIAGSRVAETVAA